MMKKILTGCLLLFVATSIAYAIVNETKDVPPVVPEQAVAATLPVVPAEQGRVVVYYFHGNMRCPTCRMIEALTREAIETGFAKDLADGKMEMLAVNVDEPANGHFVADYQLATKSVVVVRFAGNTQKEWKNLDRVWQLVQDKDAFIRYIQDETEPFLQEGK